MRKWMWLVLIAVVVVGALLLISAVGLTLNLPSVTIPVSQEQITAVRQVISTPRFEVGEVDLDVWSRGHIDVYVDGNHFAKINSDAGQSGKVVSLISEIFLPRYIAWVPKVGYGIAQFAGHFILPLKMTFKFIRA